MDNFKRFFFNYQLKKDTNFTYLITLSLDELVFHAVSAISWPFNGGSRNRGLKGVGKKEAILHLVGIFAYISTVFMKTKFANFFVIQP